MNNIRCLIVDDEPVAQRIITSYLADIPNFELVGTCLHAIDAIEILNNSKIDLMFLDIEMPKLKGLDFLRVLSHPPKVIITTAYREYALESYELDVIDYLLKPISFDRFFKAISKFLKSQPNNQNNESIPQQEKKEPVLYVRSERKTIKINQDKILFIESMNNYIIIHLADSSHIVYSSLGEFTKKLNQSFLRIHKSFVVNKNHIQSFNKEVVDIGDKQLPIGKTYKEIVSKF